MAAEYGLVHIPSTTGLSKSLTGLVSRSRRDAANLSQSPATTLMAFDFLVLDFDRADVEACDTTEVMEVLLQLLERQAAQKFGDRVDCCCTGYGSDPRELWEIPEVRRFIRKLDQQFPYWCYFLHRGGEGLLWLTYCLYPEGKGQEERQKIWPPAIRAYIENRALPAINIICRLSGCSDEEELRVTDSSVAYLVNKPVGKYQYEKYADPTQRANSVRFSRAHEKSESEAQYLCGVWYFEGDEIAQDCGLAAMWLRKAAEKNNSNAQYLLGILFHSGNGVKKDVDQAMSYYLRAAENGSKEAQSYLEKIQGL